MTEQTNSKHYFFTSESVSAGHPDKVADQISDAILDNFLAQDPQSHVAVETLVTTGLTVVAGEVSSNAYVDIQKTVRDTINRIGYTKGEYMFCGDSCGVMSAIHEQSPDIDMGVSRENEEEQGAGDQGMMFGYATNETPSYMPLTWQLATDIVKRLEVMRKEYNFVMPYLRPDAKSQVTVEYDENNHPVHIDTIVISTQHDEFGTDEEMLDRIRADVEYHVIPHVIKSNNVENLFDDSTKILVNPTGRFVIGGPHGDTGLTGRKIIVDTYGGWGAHGGGAFSGKDPSKVDRSAAYAARHIAKNLVAADVCDRCLVQLSYAIGVAQPVSVFVNTYGTNHSRYSDAEIAAWIRENIDLTPRAIEKRFDLRKPIYSETAAYGHFGHDFDIVTKTFKDANGNDFKMEVTLYPWEMLTLASTFRIVLMGDDSHIHIQQYDEF